MLFLKELSRERISTSFSVISTIFYIKYLFEYTEPNPAASIESYGLPLTLIFYIIKIFFVIVGFLFTLLNFVTAMFAEPESYIKPRVIVPRDKAVCFRVVTRGTYPHLVKENADHNLAVLKPYENLRYTYEVVTDIPIDLEKKHSKCFEVVVPADYRTKNNTKYKARALQFAIESNVSQLSDEDYIVHLDEESLLTKSCIDGIMHFVSENQHQIGQG